MDRRRFIDAAPAYYSLAIIAFLMRSSNIAYKTTIQNDYSVHFQDDDETVDYLDIEELFKAGALHATNSGMLITIKDDFGPDLYKLSDQFLEHWNNATSDPDSPYSKFHAARSEGRSWLLSALTSIKANYIELKITADEFDQPDIDWAPMQLERDSEILNTAISKLDEVIEGVRGDNGYGTAHPEEKSYVLDKLRAASARLKTETQISWIYLKEFALEPMSILIKRYGGAAIGVAALAAKEAFKEWLKKKGISFLDGL